VRPHIFQWNVCTLCRFRDVVQFAISFIPFLRNKKHVDVQEAFPEKGNKRSVYVYWSRDVADNQFFVESARRWASVMALVSGEAVLNYGHS
jgi:hypothetical protein